MRISFVLGHELPFPPEKGGGVNSLLNGLTKGLASLGHEVTAYSPSVAGRADAEIVDNVSHIRVKGDERKPSNLKNFFAGLPYAKRLKALMKETDVLSCHLLQGFLFANSPKTKIVTHTIHRDPKKFLYLFKGVDRIYAGSDAVTERAGEVVPTLKQKCKTVYNCVDFENYPHPTPINKDGIIQFLFVGRFSQDKGLATLLPAFCKAAVENRNIKLKTLGPMTAEGGADPAFVDKMRAIITEAGLQDRIEMAQPIFDRNKLDEEIKAADVVVLPSIGGETLNMSILECMRIGRALLISDLAANSPLNIEGETGFFARAGDIEDWKRKILLVANSEETVERLGVNSYQYGLEKFSCKQIASVYVDDFIQLIHSKTKKIYFNGAGHLSSASNTL